MLRSFLFKRGALLHNSIFGLNITKFAHELDPVLATAPVNRLPHVQSTTEREHYREEHKIKFKRAHQQFQENWTRGQHNRVYTEKEAMTEAHRCMKCADSPCQKACSTGIDIRQFIYQIQNQNYYGAAKTILSDNPLGLSCGGLCPVSELCASTCNAHWLEGGTIEIGKLQEFAVKVFKDMRVKQIRDPNQKPLPEKVASTKIALIGSGSASISCASFLARLGYNNVHVYEKAQFSGGLVTSEIPPNRSNISDIEWEVEMAREIGVKFFYGKEFGKDITEESLKKDGYETIFIGTGLNDPKKQLGKDIYMLPNVFSSKQFLPNVCVNTKITKAKEKIFKLHGHVVVLGIGDTAIDCARSALRVGAERVTLVFRRGFEDLRANDQLFDPALYEGINFLSNLVPLKVNKKDGKATGLECGQYVIKGSTKGKNEYAMTDEKINMEADFIITAFGSENTQSPVRDALFSNGKLDINKKTMQHNSKKHIFAGGDILGTQNLVDAVNDGKVASWFMHRHISEGKGHKVPEQPSLPGFFTEIDKVDISVTMAGVKFNNPYGLASAPPTTSYPMIRRAFEEGWGFAVVKTFVLDKDEIVNVSPRIFKATNNPLRTEASFSNIELISEKRAKYWVEGAKEIKKDFPNKVLIGSIMAAYQKDDWHALAKMCHEANFDIVELNLSCNHGMPDKGMGRACSDVPEVVQQIVRWVREYVKVPVFVKLSPNSTINEKIAEFVKKAGGAGVSATNTMFSLMDPDHNMDPYPAVGKNKHVYYGGATGPLLRPIALRVASTIANTPELKGFNLMATGGIVNAQHALAYTMFGGASVYQVCSAVQQQDFSSVISDLSTGLKALLYFTQRKDLIKMGWKGQSPPVLKTQKLKKHQNEFDLWSAGEKRTDVDISKVPTIEQVKGTGTKHIYHINDMDKDQKFPFINDDLCVNCGKCYMTCLDSGYQAIKFDTKTHKPEITSDCTGCGLCFAVCPVPGALLYDERPATMPYVPNRGDKYFSKH